MWSSRHKVILIIILAIILVAGIVVWFTNRNIVSEPPYPLPEGWSMYVSNGVMVSYPKTLPTTYIKTVDWPPQAQVLDLPYSACTEAGVETDRAGQTQKRMINGREYCVTTIVEGAAGSIYTQYAYAFPRGYKTIILTFSLRAPQCANYDDPEKTACETERRVFDIDGLVDSMAQAL